MAEARVRVVIKIRPLLPRELVRDEQECVRLIRERPQLALGKKHTFTFDDVLSAQVEQEELYQRCVAQLVNGCFEGYNATVFAYGQTGAGKTHTMGTANLDGVAEEDVGIIPRAVQHIFSQVEEKSKTCSVQVLVSFIEIYKDEVFDLLEPSTLSGEIRIREDEQGNTVLAGVSEQPVTSVEEVLSCLDTGSVARHTGSTKMNERSSRSHSVFTITIVQQALSGKGGEVSPSSEDGGGFMSAKLHLVDLAGSERASRTGAVGERFKESVHINCGLLALGNVISALGDPKKRRTSHVPYRDSKLTRLLKDALGGNSHTLMVTCLSPATADFAESLNTLKYANRAKNIQNKPVKNRDPNALRIAEMQSEIDALKEELQRTQAKHSSSALSDVDQHAEEANKVILSEEELARWQKEAQLFRRLTLDAKRHFVSLRQSNMADQQQQLLFIEQWLLRLEESLHNGALVGGEEHEELQVLREELKRAEEERSNALERLANVEWRYAQLKERQLRSQSEEFDENLDKPMRLSEEAANEEEEACHVPPVEPAMLPADVVTKISQKIEQLKAETIANVPEVFQASPFEGNEPPEMQQSSKHISGPSSRSISYSGLPAEKVVEKEKSNSLQRDGGLGAYEHEGYNRGLRNSLVELNTSATKTTQEMRHSQMRTQDARQKLRNLTLAIRLKEQLMCELVKSERDALQTTEKYKQRLQQMEEEVQLVQSEYDTSQRARLLAEQYAHSQKTEQDAIRSKYERHLKEAASKLKALQTAQRATEQMSRLQSQNSRRLAGLEATVAHMRGERDELRRRLKQEAETKTRLERNLHQERRRIQELERQTKQRQRLLSRRTDETRSQQEQRELKEACQHIENDDAPTVEGLERAPSRQEQQEQWLDDEVAAALQRRQAIQQLQQDMMKRQKILEEREALIAEKVALDEQKLQSDRKMSTDMMLLNAEINQLEEKVQQKEDLLQAEPAKDLCEVETELLSLRQERERLVESRKEFEERLGEDETAFHPQEERRRIELEEAIEALDAAIEFKSQSIAEQQDELSGLPASDGQNDHVFARLGQLEEEEAKALLARFFVKVVDARAREKEALSERRGLEVQLCERDEEVHQLESALQAIKADRDRRLTLQQKEHEQKVQFLMQQLASTSSEVPVKIPQQPRLIDRMFVALSALLAVLVAVTAVLLS